ncbi:hypothetical protein D3C80_1458640 [compost metagenome]
MVISYFIGYKYKDYLNVLLSPAIYYQAVVFISLTMPLIVSGAYRFISKHWVMWRLNNFKKKKIDVSKLDDSTKEMYLEIVNQDIPTKNQIKEMHEALMNEFK